jgi:hypothetical protein
MMVGGKQGFGYIESAQELVEPAGRVWDVQTLRRAAEAAQIRNMGWPIGIVFDAPGGRVVPDDDGIVFRYERSVSNGGPGWEDYWRFRRDGRYYVVRIFEEEFRTEDSVAQNGAQARAISIPTRVWRIAEVILHSAALYRELGIAPNEPYLLRVGHGGLASRELDTRELVRWRQNRHPAKKWQGRAIAKGPALQDEVAWTGEVTQDYVIVNLHGLVLEVARSLFALFAFADVPEAVVREIVDEFAVRV